MRLTELENKKIKLSLAMLNVINQQPEKTGADSASGLK